jgi:two-component system, cell cycle response regulator
LQVFAELHAAANARQRRASAPADVPAAPTALTAPDERAAGAPPGARHRSGDAHPAVIALLVDDSDIALRYLQRLLHGIGLRAESASTSTQALELAHRMRPDVVFLDVELGPGSDLDGFELCQRFKQAAPLLGKPIKVVMLSAHNAPSDQVKGTFVGCDAYLSKPADEAALRRVLREFGLVGSGLLPRRRQRGEFSTSRTGVPED